MVRTINTQQIKKECEKDRTIKRRKQADPALNLPLRLSHPDANEQTHLFLIKAEDHGPLFCPICSVFMHGTFQCENDHLICEKCHKIKNIVSCPTCSTPVHKRAKHIELISNCVFRNANTRGVTLKV